MRIIAGKHKGLNLHTFNLETTRPTSDLIRGAIFNTINLKIEHSKFLDLFAGTGAIGLEALSRNSSVCYFFDENNESINLIKKNAEKFTDCNYKIYKMDYISALTFLKTNKISFDIIFLDPPYLSNFAENSIFKILNFQLLNANGVIVWEHNKSKLDFIKQKFPKAITKKYGEKFVTYISQNA